MLPCHANMQYTNTTMPNQTAASSGHCHEYADMLPVSRWSGTLPCQSVIIQWLNARNGCVTYCCTFSNTIMAMCAS